jgi:hypothetical protein
MASLSPKKAPKEGEFQRPSCSKKKAPKEGEFKRPSCSKEDAAAKHQGLLEESICCINFLSTNAAANAIAIRKALSWLDQNPTARNLVVSVGPERFPACTTKQVLDAHIGPHDHDGASFAPIWPTANGKTLAHGRVEFLPNVFLKRTC